MIENIVTGKKYRILTDEENDEWDRTSFWTHATDVEFSDGKNLEEKMLELTFKLKDFIEGYQTIDEKFIYNGSTQQFIVPQTGFYKITLVGGSHLGYQQNFYAGMNVGTTHHTELSIGGLVTATYLLRKNDIISMQLGNCFPKTTTTINCNNETGQNISAPVSGVADSSKLYINNTLYMTANGGSISNLYASVTLVTDGTAGSTQDNPKYVCNGYTGTTYAGGSGECISNDSYQAYDVVILTRSNNNLNNYVGYCNISTTNKPSDYQLAL